MSVGDVGDTSPVISYPTFSELYRLLSRYFVITQSVIEFGMPVFAFKWPDNTIPSVREQESVFQDIDTQAERLRVWPIVRWLDKSAGVYVVRFVPIQNSSPPDRRINYALFVATLASIALGGFLQATSPVFLTLFYPHGWSIIDIVLVTLLFIASVMGIFFTHEMGHYLTAKRRGIEATLPYFIPGIPELGGTFGAFIQQRTPPKNRSDLFDLGVAGPFCGFIVTLVVLIVGFSLSVPLTAEQLSAIEDAFPGMTGALPVPLLFSVLELVFSGMIPEGGTIYLHPIGYTAWVGCLVTALNLFPVSQLDGGHALRSIVGQRLHKYIGWIAILLMMLMGFVLMALLVLFLSQGGEHPGPLNDTIPVSKSRVVLFILAMIVLVLSIPPLGLALF